MTTVLIIESEVGWGQKVDKVKHFSNYKEAKEFCDGFNKDNNLPCVPDWYMYAEIVE